MVEFCELDIPTLFQMLNKPKEKFYNDWILTLIRLLKAHVAVTGQIRIYDLYDSLSFWMECIGWWKKTEVKKSLDLFMGDTD